MSRRRKKHTFLQPCPRGRKFVAYCVRRLSLVLTAHTHTDTTVQFHTPCIRLAQSQLLPRSPASGQTRHQAKQDHSVKGKETSYAACRKFNQSSNIQFFFVLFSFCTSLMCLLTRFFCCSLRLVPRNEKFPTKKRNYAHVGQLQWKTKHVLCPNHCSSLWSSII